jgi:hypothetical protein
MMHSRGFQPHLALASSAPAGTLSAGITRQRAPVGLVFGPFAAIVVVSRFLELLDSRRFDLAGLEFQRHWRIVQRALEAGYVPGHYE